MVEKSIKNKVPLSCFWYSFFKLIMFIGLISLPFSIADFGMAMFVSFFILFGIPIGIYFYLSYKNFSFVIDDEKITTYTGILSKTTKTIPFNNIQNIEINNGIISRLFNVAGFNIWTSSPSQIEIRRGESENNPDMSFYIGIDDANNIREIIYAKK